MCCFKKPLPASCFRMNVAVNEAEMQTNWEPAKLCSDRMKKVTVGVGVGVSACHTKAARQMESLPGVDSSL